MGETFTKAGEEAVTIGTIHAAAKRKEKSYSTTYSPT